MLDVDPQVNAVLACLPVREDGMVSIGELAVDGRIWTAVVSARPLAATIAARVLRSVADQYPTSGMIPIGTLRHMADDLEDGAT